MACFRFSSEAPAARRRRALIFYRALGWLAAAILLSPTFAQADDDALMQRVHQFLHDRAQSLGEEILIDLRPPSPHLPACENPEPFLPNADAAPLGHVTVGVRCGPQQRQMRYMQADINIVGKYMVAARDIDRGTRITPDLLRRETGNLGELSSRALIEEEALTGMITRRAVRRGSVFQQQDVRAPLMVKRGETVTVVAAGQGFRVSREGEAMENGSKGERIRVRLARREILDARVVGQGVLHIDF